MNLKREAGATFKNFVLLRIGGEAPLVSTQEGPGGGRSTESVVPLLWHLPQNSKNKKEIFPFYFIYYISCKKSDKKEQTYVCSYHIILF